MKIKLLDGGIMPTRAHFDDAGIDFYCPKQVAIGPMESVVVDLRVAVQIPVGYCGEMLSKSGLNINHNIQCTGLLVDSSFRGTLKVRMVNNSLTPYLFNKGDKIVQMKISPCSLFDLEPVDNLDPSVSGRDENGYGSSGK